MTVEHMDRRWMDSVERDIRQTRECLGETRESMQTISTTLSALATSLKDLPVRLGALEREQVAQGVRADEARKAAAEAKADRKWLYGVAVGAASLLFTACKALGL